jgi:hypothetical protein
MSNADELVSISIEESSIEHFTSIRVLIDKIATQDWYKQIESNPERQKIIIDKVKTFCSLAWVEELDDEQRFECFLGYLQYDFLKQGLRRQNRSRDFLFYGFSAIGGKPPSLDTVNSENR